MVCAEKLGEPRKEPRRLYRLRGGSVWWERPPLTSDAALLSTIEISSREWPLGYARAIT
jgi:hypothetical protein